MSASKDENDPVDQDVALIPPVFDRNANPTEFGRLLALSDGVFAIALTLLVLDLSVPTVLSDGGLGSALLDEQAHFIAFGISLLLVGSAWWAHHRLFSMLQGVDGPLMALNIVYLGLVVLIPFAQSTLALHVHEPLSYVIFAGIFAGTNAVDTLMFAYGRSRDLLRVPVSPVAYRWEILFGGTYVAVFLASMPAAYLLGPYTMIIWLLLLPAGAVLNRIQSGRSAPAGPTVEEPTEPTGSASG